MACRRATRAISRLDGEVNDARAQVQNYLRTTDPSFKADFRGSMASVRDDLQIIENSTLQNGAIQADVRLADQQFQTVFSWLDLAVEQQDKHRHARAVQVLGYEWGAGLIGDLAKVDSDLADRSQHDLMIAEFEVKVTGFLFVISVFAASTVFAYGRIWRPKIISA